VLSCLNSGLYSASRVLFVLAAQREAPAQIVKVSRRGVPYIAIVCSSVVGFLCVIMAGVAPDTVFLFLLNSSGAIVLFVYLLIALSQIVLRLKTPPEKLRVKMWFFPVLSILTVAGILGVLVQMAFDSSARVQFWLSLLSWAVVLALYFASKWWRRRVDPPTAHAKSGLVLASETAWEPQAFDTQQHTDPEQATE
jgi:GABA permease